MKNKIVNKYLYILLLIVATPIAFAFSGVMATPEVEAYYGKSAVSSKSYTFQRWLSADDIRTITTGSVDITHIFQMTKGDYTVVPGNEIDFSYSPNIFYYAYNGAWDTPYGGWCPTINNRCTALSGYQLVHDNIGLDWWMSKDYTASGYTYTEWYNIGISENRWNRAQIGWTGIKPVGYVTSSNASVVSCSGLDCVAVGPGTATITAHGPTTQTRIWAYVGFIDNTSLQWISETMPYLNSVKTNITWIPAKTVGSWVINVKENGTCGAKNLQRHGNYTVAETTYPIGSVWCNTGNAGTANPSFKYPSLGETVTWECAGINGGTTANCSAIREDAPPAPPVCGDGVILLPETCDDGNVVSGDGCSSICLIEAIPGSCGSKPFQRHGTYTSIETTWPVGSNWCDKGTSTGNSFPAIGASSSWVCAGLNGGGNATCTATRTGTPVNASCGTKGSPPLTGRDYRYGITNWIVGDTTCSSGTSAEPTFPAQPSSPSYNSTTRTWTCAGINGGSDVSCLARRLGPVCTNGYTEPGEACDGGTYCTASCTIIPANVCGNGVLETGIGETCDDGNVINGDLCSSTCLIEVPSVCGDGNCQLGENFLICPIDCSAAIIEF